MHQSVKSAYLVHSAQITVSQLCRASATVVTSALLELAKPILRWTLSTKTTVPAPVSPTVMPQVAQVSVEVPFAIQELIRTRKAQQSSLTVHLRQEANTRTLLT